MTNTPEQNKELLQGIEFNLHNIQMHTMAIKRDNKDKNSPIIVYLNDIDKRVDSIRKLLNNIN
jgi:hypothetical protein